MSAVIGKGGERREHPRVVPAFRITAMIDSPRFYGVAAIHDLSLGGLRIVYHAAREGEILQCRINLPDFADYPMVARVVNHVGKCAGLRIISGKHKQGKAIETIFSSDLCLGSMQHIDDSHCLYVKGNLGANAGNQLLGTVRHFSHRCTLDLSGVMAIDAAGAAACVSAIKDHGAMLRNCSPHAAALFVEYGLCAHCHVTPCGAQGDCGLIETAALRPEWWLRCAGNEEIGAA